jgi:hypothetical protein
MKLKAALLVAVAAMVFSLAWTSPAVAGPHGIALWPLGLRPESPYDPGRPNPRYAVTGEFEQYKPNTYSQRLFNRIPASRNTNGFGQATR